MIPNMFPIKSSIPIQPISNTISPGLLCSCFVHEFGPGTEATFPALFDGNVLVGLHILDSRISALKVDRPLTHGEKNLKNTITLPKTNIAIENPPF